MRAAKEAYEKFGRIDILVNSAGITGATVPVQDFPIDSWQRTLAINVNGVFFACREIIPYMLENGYGRIVNVASVAGKEGNPNASAYSASKAAVIGFTKSLGKELALRGILANAITPATFESPILQQLPQSQVDYMRAQDPDGTPGRSNGERRHDLLHGERGVQLHHRVRLRYLRRAHHVLTVKPALKVVR